MTGNEPRLLDSREIIFFLQETDDVISKHVSMRLELFQKDLNVHTNVTNRFVLNSTILLAWVPSSTSGRIARTIRKMTQLLILAGVNNDDLRYL